MTKSKKLIVAMVFILIAFSFLLGSKNYAYADYVRPENESTEIILRKVGDPSFKVVMDKDALVEKIGEYDSEHYKVKLFECNDEFYVKKEHTTLIERMDSKKQVVLKNNTKLRINIDEEISVSPDDKYTMYRIGHQQGNEEKVCVWLVNQKGSFVGFINKDDIKEGEKIVIKKPVPKKTLGLKLLVILITTIPMALFLVFMIIPSKKYYVRQTPVLIDGTADVDKSEQKPN